jgi:antitoxin component of RelBE/YafQ-DinJ toxin-antitoxin module
MLWPQWDCPISDAIRLLMLRIVDERRSPFEMASASPVSVR